ncbi:hypothetical protein HYT57_01755 [Candidatus Woesearchaeota archaeon]|nr:hypothetical protein [Candidatus Woesearchaeota archaeon]
MAINKGIRILTKKLYEKLSENKIDKSLKPYRSRIKELRENIGLVKEIHRVATQRPEERFMGDSIDSGSAFYGVGNHTFSNGETIQIGVLVLGRHNDKQFYECRLWITGPSILLINQKYHEEPQVITSRIFGLVKKDSDYIGFLSEDFGEITPGPCPKGIERLFTSDLDHICFWNKWNKEKSEDLKHFAIDFNTTSPKEEYKQEWWSYQEGIERSLDEFVINIS